MLTLFTTPVVYLYMERFGRWARSLRLPSVRFKPAPEGQGA
jgi:hypothetical protein